MISSPMAHRHTLLIIYNILIAYLLPWRSSVTINHSCNLVMQAEKSEFG